MADWKGSYYSRVRSNDYRNRKSGIILKNVKVQKRKGMRNKAIFWNGSNWKGIEKTYKHIYSEDAKKSPSAKKKFITRVQANRPFAKKRRKAHKRRIR